MMVPYQILLLAFVVCLTLFNVLLWSKSNYGFYEKPKEVLPSGTDQELLLDIQDKINGLMQTRKTSPEFQSLFAEMKAYSTGQVTTRKSVLGQVSSADQFPLLYGALAPEVFCPEKVRVGTIGDGGKWVCNPWNVPEDSVLFSLGLNNYINFEEEWQKLNKNRNILYGFDVDTQKDETLQSYSQIRGTAMKAKISPETSIALSAYTISDLAKHFNVSKIEILKIDIEGAELTCLIPFLKNYEVCQIYIEIHGGAPEHAHLLAQIAHLGYRLFSYEVNGYAMNACEYSFIHEKCVEKYGGLKVANYLDFEN